MKASIRYISELTGFSPATVSNALNHKKGVNAKTAAEDACRMEHVLSAQTFEAIKRHITLGHELPDGV